MVSVIKTATNWQQNIFTIEAPKSPSNTRRGD